MKSTKKKLKQLEKINKPIKIFLSYSNPDKEYKDSLMKHLSLLIRKNQIELWDDEDIAAGVNWKNEIETKLKEAEIAVLLVSSDFLSSNHINEFEIPRLLEQSEKGETTIIPILVRPVYWQGSELSNFQGLPKKGKAISHWQNEDEAWINVVSEIAKIIEKKQRVQSETKIESKWTVENIKKLILKDQMTKATKELEELINQKEDKEELMNSLTLITGRLNHLERNSRLGILSHHDQMLERNKITYSILNLLEEI